MLSYLSQLQADFSAKYQGCWIHVSFCAFSRRDVRGQPLSHGWGSAEGEFDHRAGEVNGPDKVGVFDRQLKV